VWDAFGGEPDVAGAEALLLVLGDEAEFAFEDVEDLVFGVVDVQWGGIAEGDAVFENGDAVLAVGFGDANGDGGVEEPEGSGVDEREGGCVWDGRRGAFVGDDSWRAGCDQA
jgi:hypothetical protein